MASNDPGPAGADSQEEPVTCRPRSQRREIYLSTRDRLGRGLSVEETNPHILTPGEFVERRQRRDHFLTTVLEAPKLFVIGSDLELEAVGR